MPIPRKAWLACLVPVAGILAWIFLLPMWTDSWPREPLVVAVECGETTPHSCWGYYIDAADHVYSVSAHTKDEIDTNSKVPVSDLDAARALALKSSLPAGFKSLPSHQGRPDHHDQCGIVLVFPCRFGQGRLHLDPDSGMHDPSLSDFVLKAKTIWGLSP